MVYFDFSTSHVLGRACENARTAKKRPRDTNQLAWQIVQEATGQAPPEAPAVPDIRNPHALALSSLGAPAILSMSRIIHVLLLREGDYWVAQALDVDIAAQGRSVPLAQKAFVQAIQAQLRLDASHGREPFQGIPAAPQQYWETFFRHARDLEQTVMEGDEIPPAYMIQAIADEGALNT